MNTLKLELVISGSPRFTGASPINRQTAWITLSYLLLAACAGPVPDHTDLPVASALRRFEFAQRHMGMRVGITFYAPDRGLADAAADDAFARIGALDTALSDYNPQSESMRLADSAVAEAIPVSADLFLVLARSLALSEATGGAFDVTVGPIVALWREARGTGSLPKADALAEAKSRTGWRLVELDDDARTVRLDRSGMKLDFGGIAKGYAGDQARAALAAHGITRCLISVGGDLVLGDPPPEQSAWRIRLESGSDASGYNLQLANCAIATSGDAYQFVEIGRVRYSHLVDPATGLGLTTRATVTVIAPTGIEADGLASAVSVLGETRGLALIDGTPGASVRIEFASGSGSDSGGGGGDGPRIVRSDSFPDGSDR